MTLGLEDCLVEKRAAGFGDGALRNGNERDLFSFGSCEGAVDATDLVGCAAKLTCGDGRELFVYFAGGLVRGVSGGVGGFAATCTGIPR